MTGNSASEQEASDAPKLAAPLWALVHEDWIAHGRDWTLPGFRAVAVCRFGQWRMSIRSKFIRAPLSVLYRILYRHCRSVYGIELPYTVELGRRVVIEHQSGIIVHGLCKIGDECILRQGVTLGNRRPADSFDAPVLLQRVNVGAGAKILGRVTIGDDAQIGANAVILDDVPAGAAAVGIPAKIIERRAENTSDHDVPLAETVHATEHFSVAALARSIGLVVIGRNEGERLHRCLATLKTTGCPIIYVDSGSTDGSLSRAQTFGVQTIELDSSKPFTAARGRNAGWRRLLELHPDLQYIQFIDGDCELAEGWLSAAVRFADAHPDAAVVCGRRREIDPARNIYHLWTDIEWDTPVGEAQHCGGDALIRTAALLPVGGYREDMIAGEEPELCVRLRTAGWKVWRIEHEMTRHDIAIHSFSQWWRRSVRSGYAYAEGSALHGAPPEHHWVCESRSIWIWGAAIPAAALLLAWPSGALSILWAALAYLALFTKIVFSRAASRMEPVVSAAPFAAWCVAMKWPQAVGQTLYWFNKWRGTQIKIIEYNTPSATKATANMR